MKLIANVPLQHGRKSSMTVSLKTAPSCVDEDGSGARGGRPKPRAHQFLDTEVCSNSLTSGGGEHAALIRMDP
jgi:hypothetical protein